MFLKQTMKTTDNQIEDKEYEYIANLTNNYSNSDLKELFVRLAIFSYSLSSI